MTKNVVCNLALAHIGVTGQITDIDNEKTEEAKVLRLFYSVALQEILTRGRWKFATRDVALSLVEENPTPQWKFSYRYPSDCLFLRRLNRDKAQGQPAQYRNITGDADVEYEIVGDETSRLIYTDQENAHCEYTKDIKTFGTLPAHFIMAFSFLLAYYISPKLCRTDSGKLSAEMLKKYEMKFLEALSLNFNEANFKEEDPRSSLERSRQGM